VKERQIKNTQEEAEESKYTIEELKRKKKERIYGNVLVYDVVDMVLVYYSFYFPCFYFAFVAYFFCKF